MTLADIRPGLRTLLLSNAEIASAVGNERIYPLVLPQGVTKDSIVYNRVVESESYHFTGPSGLVISRMQIDVWSQSVDQANALADLIKEHIGGFAGHLNYNSSSPSAGYVNVQGVFMLSGDDGEYDSQAGMYRRRRDYSIIYEDRNV